jgi:uncharacterized lipoprotein YddW (UPF0748 family)
MLTIKIMKDTFFKSSTESSEQLNSDQKFLISKGTELKIKSYFKQGNHYFVKLTQELGLVGKSGFIFENHAQVEEIRGVWITNIDSEILESKENIKKHLAILKQLGFNTLYPVVWNKGFAFFKSQIADNTEDADLTKLASVNLNQELAGRDVLAEIIEINQAEGHNFRIIAWFEYGLMVHPNAPLVTNKPEWFMLTHKQQKTVDGNFRLNPTHPEVQDFIVSLIREVVKNYDIDGIQLDDHFAIHHSKLLNDGTKTFDFSMGFDPFTIKLFQKETSSVSPMSNPNLAKFKDWRKGKLTQLVRLIFKGIKAEKEDCILSISPNPLEFSIDHALADWQAWEQEGLAEELAIQVYRYEGTFAENMRRFESEIDKAAVKATRDHIPTVIGIMTGLRPDDKRVNLNLIQAQTQETRDRDFAGFAYFFYGSLFEQIPTTETVQNREDTFAQILSTDQFV